MFPEQLFQPFLRINAHPARVDYDAFMPRNLFRHLCQEPDVLCIQRIRRARILWLHQRCFGDGVKHRFHIVGLVRIDRQQAHKCRHHPLGNHPLVFHHVCKFVFYALIFLPDFFRQAQLHRDFLIFRELFPHVIQREEHGVIHQEPRIDQRRYARELLLP